MSSGRQTMFGRIIISAAGLNHNRRRVKMYKILHTYTSCGHQNCGEVLHHGFRPPVQVRCISKLCFALYCTPELCDCNNFTNIQLQETFEYFVTVYSLCGLS